MPPFVEGRERTMASQDDRDIQQGLEQWEAGTLQGQLATMGERKPRFETDSGIPVKSLYTPLDAMERDYLESLGFPGEYPFTRGADPNMYRSRIYGTAQFTGFATPAETNQLYRRLLAQGMTSLYMACDLPCQLGYDSDDPRALGEVGKCGVAINSIQDMETILAGIDLARTRITIVSNANAPVILAMLDVVAEQQGADKGKVSGFIQNDILKEFFARNTYIFPIDPSLRLHSDTIVFCKSELPAFHPFNPISYQIREAGATAVQEAAFTLADAATYVENAGRRGIPADELGPLFFTIIVNHRDFFEEIAKIRAMRRIWARLMKERLGAKRDEACALRFHASQGAVGLNLTRSLPEANIARCTLAGLAGVLSGAQSVGIRTMDEAYGIPSAKASLISLRTLQIIAEETGVTNTVDPLAGSYLVEWLTDEVERRINACLARIDALGGMVSAIKAGYVQGEIARSAFEYERDLEEKRKITVGMNLHVDPVEEDGGHACYQLDPALQAEQIQQLAEFKRRRDQGRVAAALQVVRETAARPEGNDSNLMAPIKEAVRSHATLGEIVRALKDVFGEHREGAA
jgi:methylmalonyl-CoA mutase N-terminal domain/subunit